MTHPKPPNNFSCEGDSPKNDVTFDGISVEESIDTPDYYYIPSTTTTSTVPTTIGSYYCAPTKSLGTPPSDGFVETPASKEASDADLGVRL